MAFEAPSRWDPLSVFWALLVHIVVLLLAALLIYFIGSDQSALTDAVRSQYSDRPATIEDIRAEAIWQIIEWCLLSLAVSWLLASLWLLIAGRTMPRSPAEGASRQGSWVGLLLIVIAVFVALGFVMLRRTGMWFDLASSMATSGSLIVALATILAYYLATAMAVKTTMRPSVPLSGLTPSLSRRKA